MRKALATVALAGGLVLAPVATAPALAAAPVTAPVLANNIDDTDKDEFGNRDGDDDSGRYGLMGLLGLAGLFGYKKYKDHRAASGQRVGTVDTDGSGSRRI